MKNEEVKVGMKVCVPLRNDGEVYTVKSIREDMVFIDKILLPVCAGIIEPVDDLPAIDQTEQNTEIPVEESQYNQGFRAGLEKAIEICSKNKLECDEMCDYDDIKNFLTQNQ
jgi:hypothetical protein